MVVQINGESREVREGSTLAGLISDLALTPARIAVELNQKVVRRDQWDETILSAGDRIEIVHFVGGGCLERGHPCPPGERRLGQTNPGIILDE